MSEEEQARLLAVASKCADCDAPAVRLSSGDGGPGSDPTAKPRCERHAWAEREGRS